MEYKLLRKKKALCILLAFSFIIFIGDTNLWAAEKEEMHFDIYGVVQSVNFMSRTFILKSGEKIYLTKKTHIKNMKGRRVSFSDLIKPGAFIGILTKEEKGKYIALSIWESGEG